jgi:rhodanese-related sulfurtransferase
MDQPDVVDYLLLDLREEAEYDECHIAGARLHPGRLFKHAHNPFNADVLAYVSTWRMRMVST